MDYLSKKKKNGVGGTKTTSASGFANGSNAKTDLVTSMPPKQNVQMCEGIFVDYVNIYFQVNLRAYIQYASIDDDYFYKVGCVGNFLKFFAKSFLCGGVQRRS